MSAVAQWVSRKTPGESPAVPTTTPRGFPSVGEKVDLTVDASREHREEEEEKTRITPNGLGMIPKSPTGWSRVYEKEESGGFLDEEPTVLKGLRKGNKCLRTIKRVRGYLTANQIGGARIGLKAKIV